VVEQPVVVEHDPGSSRLQRPEHPVRQLGQHLRRGAARQRWSRRASGDRTQVQVRAGSRRKIVNAVAPSWWVALSKTDDPPHSAETGNTIHPCLGWWAGIYA
jgi:hypothetical protein